MSPSIVGSSVSAASSGSTACSNFHGCPRSVGSCAATSPRRSRPPRHSQHTAGSPSRRGQGSARSTAPPPVSCRRTSTMRSPTPASRSRRSARVGGAGHRCADSDRQRTGRPVRRGAHRRRHRTGAARLHLLATVRGRRRGVARLSVTAADSPSSGRSGLCRRNLNSCSSPSTHSSRNATLAGSFCTVSCISAISSSRSSMSCWNPSSRMSRSSSRLMR